MRKSGAYYQKPLQTQSKLIDPNNWHWTPWFSFIYLHSLEGATALMLKRANGGKIRVFMGVPFFDALVCRPAST